MAVGVAGYEHDSIAGVIVKRFDPMDDEMIQFPEGEWVRYSDAVVAVSAARDRCASICDEAARRLRNSGCKHEAAAVECAAEDIRSKIVDMSTLQIP
jgi:hypothetical protein